MKVFKEKAFYHRYFSWLRTTAIHVAARNFLTWLLHLSPLKRAARDGDLLWNLAGIQMRSAIVSALCLFIVGFFFYANRPQNPRCCFDKAYFRILFRQAHKHNFFVPRGMCTNGFHVSATQSYLSGQPKHQRGAFHLKNKNKKSKTSTRWGLRSCLNGGSHSAAMR